MKNLRKVSSMIENIPYIDQVLSESILRDVVQPSESLFLLLCHLSIACRNGHLCVRIDSNSVTPDPEELWEEISDPITLRAKIIEGVSQIPTSLITEVKDVHHSISTPLCRYQNLFYFQRYWNYEAKFYQNLLSIAQTAPTISIESRHVQSVLENEAANDQLLPEQSRAIQLAIDHSLTIICGGPGTGKTYTAGRLIQLIWESLTPEQQHSFTISLAAPTGKAASQLESSLRKATTELDLQAQTLHTLLGIKRSHPVTLSSDLIVIDECSMIDVRLMARLFQSIRPGTRLVLLGDPNQLPPVENGALFTDLVTQHDAVAILSQCLRSDLKAINEFATAIKDGDVKSALNKDEIPRFNLEGFPSQLQQEILQQSLPYFHTDTTDPLELFARFSRFRILTPFRKGPFGVEAMNQLFVEAIPTSVRPILLVSNDHRLQLANGETGIMIDDMAYFLKGSQIKEVPRVLLPHFEYAYCMSVHKSQGSEFENVLLLLPEGAERFGREVLYTGVTRAKKSLSLWCKESTLVETIHKKSIRFSRQYFIKEFAQ